jgi:hypothetical protein
MKALLVLRSSVFSGMVVTGAILFVCMNTLQAAPSNRPLVKPIHSPEVESDKELPKSGSLATSSISGAASATFPDPFGGNDPSGREVSPIAGSVSRLSSERWEMKVFNNADDTYSVSVDVVQRDLRGSEVKRDSFSYTLKPHTSKSEKLAVGPGAELAELTLRNWRNETRKVREKEKQSATPASAQGLGN